jgi:mannan endo-1,4-beta-mannosidase
MSKQHPSGHAPRAVHHRSPGSLIGGVALLAVVGLLLGALLFLYSNVRQLEAPSFCSRSQFVTAYEDTLCAAGHPLRLTGYNWRWVGTDCPAPTDAQIEQTFTQIRLASRANAVRTAFFQSGSGAGSYTVFDRYIAAAKRNHLYILPVLANQWTNCEPSAGPKTVAWYQSGYKAAGDGYPLSYRDYVKNLVAHYANEPTIAFWQLVNEPDPLGATCGAPAAQTLRAFEDDMTSVVRSVDPHHLVDLGTPGDCAGNNLTDYHIIAAGAAGVADVWHDYNQVTVPVPSRLLERIQTLQALDKPAYVGESGICADVGTDGACAGTVSQATLERRAVFFDAKLAAGFNLRLSGYLIWNRGSQSIQYDVGPGDPTERTLAKYALAPPPNGFRGPYASWLSSLSSWSARRR